MQIKFWHICLVLFISATASLVWMSRNRDFGSEGQLIVRPDNYNDGIVIFSWDGAIEPPMARDFSIAFDEWKTKSTRIVIDLNSPGGIVSEGDEVIKIIKRMKRTHSVETYVGAESSCLSMCVPIYLQGRLRVAAASSRWMFHEASFQDTFSGEQTYTYEFERRQASQDFFHRYFDRSDMDPKWRDKLAHEWRGQEVWKTGQELKDERSNIVMVVE